MPVCTLSGMERLGRWPRTFITRLPLSPAMSSTGCSGQVYGRVLLQSQLHPAAGLSASIRGTASPARPLSWPRPHQAP